MLLVQVRSLRVEFRLKILTCSVVKSAFLNRIRMAKNAWYGRSSAAYTFRMRFKRLYPPPMVGWLGSVWGRGGGGGGEC